jgi:hypothetical protein
MKLALSLALLSLAASAPAPAHACKQDPVGATSSFMIEILKVTADRLHLAGETQYAFKALREMEGGPYAYSLDVVDAKGACQRWFYGVSVSASCEITVSSPDISGPCG